MTRPFRAGVPTTGEHADKRIDVEAVPGVRGFSGVLERAFVVLRAGVAECRVEGDLADVAGAKSRSEAEVDARGGRS